MILQELFKELKEAELKENMPLNRILKNSTFIKWLRDNNMNISRMSANEIKAAYMKYNHHDYRTSDKQPSMYDDSDDSDPALKYIGGATIAGLLGLLDNE